jgi:predicted mannosyl-3-phosphoglycerate phosphatase (HAD superfamily)
LRQTSCVVYIAVDSLIPSQGHTLAGFAEFTAELDLLGIPAVWLTSRSRLQFDTPRRRLSHGHPFLAEGGCGVYLPEDYFHLRPDSADSGRQKTPAIRLGRFTCIPAAQLPPAAANALERLSEDTGTPIVNLRSLSPRELVQNTGLPLREAELARQRDFDELFFFAGTSEENIQSFLAEARTRHLQLRQNGVLWSLSIGASTQHCIRELTKLYDRSLRYHAETLAIATPDLAQDLFPHCERRVLLTTRKAANDEPSQITSHAREIPIHSANVWEQILEDITAKN